MHHVYDLFLRLLPEDFRRRYGVEMALDFEDGWREAATGGWRRRVEFGMRASGDLAVSLLREWTRSARLGVVAATASVTALLWGLALRPWSWHWQTSPRPRHAYDQAHFIKEFFEFSGVNPSTYLAYAGPHANHLPLPD